jgi:hypothetical protein
MEGWLGDARKRDEFAALADRAVVAYNERFWDDALGAYSVRPQRRVGPAAHTRVNAPPATCADQPSHRRWAGARADY